MIYILLFLFLYMFNQICFLTFFVFASPVVTLSNNSRSIPVERMIRTGCARTSTSSKVECVTITAHRQRRYKMNSNIYLPSILFLQWQDSSSRPTQPTARRTCCTCGRRMTTHWSGVGCHLRQECKVIVRKAKLIFNIQGQSSTVETYMYV